MATLKLKKPASGEPARKSDRPPVRGAGSGVRKRPTLAEAEIERAARKEAAAARRAEEQAPARRRDEPSPPSSRPPAGRARNAGSATPGSRAAWPPARPQRAGERGSERAGDRRAGERSDATPHRPRTKAAHEAAAPALAPAASASSDGSLRLSKRMSELGLASRREADEWIAAGWVRVDGQVVDQLGARVQPSQQISIDSQAKQQQAQRVTVLLHKPIGYVSGQAEDGYEPAVVLVAPANHWAADRSNIKFSAAHLRHLAPAGRLDIDSTGLLVLTQDGRVAKQLIGGDSAVEKEYLVRVSWPERPEVADVSKHFPAEKLALLRHGLSLDNIELKPAKVSWQNEQQLRFVLREGKKRQIRRMCELVGLQVTGLKRVRMGRVALGDLPVGQWRYLRWDEAFA